MLSWRRFTLTSPSEDRSAFPCYRAVKFPTSRLLIRSQILYLSGSMKWLCLFAALAAFFVTNLHAREAWVTLTDCQYVANDSNDGDSFHVRAGDKEYVFRLYFVDAPEIDSINPPRLVEQAKYFGLTVPEVIELGRAANAYAHERLAEPFSVTTRFAHSMARGKAERFLAFVQTKEGDLGEQLVANGLARIYRDNWRSAGRNDFRRKKKENSKVSKMKRRKNMLEAGAQRESS